MDLDGQSLLAHLHLDPNGRAEDLASDQLLLLFRSLPK
jgi:hypothetical protein